MKKTALILLTGVLLLAGCGNEAENYRKLADEYYAKGQYDYAAYNYVMAMETDRENETDYLRLVDSYIELGKLDKALKYLETAEEKFGEEKLEDLREELDELIAETTIPKIPADKAGNEAAVTPAGGFTAGATPVPEVTTTPAVPTVVPTEIPEVSTTPTVNPTEIPEPTATPVPEYTFTELAVVRYVTEDVNVRDLPSVDGKIIGSLGKGAEISILRQCNETGWYEFEYNGEKGYSNNWYFSTEKPAAASETKPENTPTPEAEPENTPTPELTEETKEIPDKRDSLKEYIMTYGTEMADHSFRIDGSEKELDFGISYDKEEDLFGFHVVSEFDDILVVIYFKWNDWMGDAAIIHATIFMPEEKIGYSMIGELDVKEYKGEAIGFQVVEHTGNPEESLKEPVTGLAQVAFLAGMFYIDNELQEQAGVSLQEIGFDSLVLTEETIGWVLE